MLRFVIYRRKHIIHIGIEKEVEIRGEHHTDKLVNICSSVEIIVNTYFNL
jgi:hypothetical protein